MYVFYKSTTIFWTLVLPFSNPLCASKVLVSRKKCNSLYSVLKFQSPLYSYVMNVLSMDTTTIPEVSSRGESRSISSKKALTGNGPVSIAFTYTW